MTRKTGPSVARATKATAEVAAPDRAMSRITAGTLAGLVATLPMTAAMRRMHRRLEREDQYPLPPREIVESVAPDLPEPKMRDTTLLAHFAYGAASGAAIAALGAKPTLRFGIASGVAVWLASYLGWIPAARILEPANRHPKSRNALMITAHMVWGLSYALASAELMQSEDVFEDGPLKDAA